MAQESWRGGFRSIGMSGVIRLVRFWTEPVGERFGKIGTHEVHRVVCNLVNGLPPRYREEPTHKTTKTATR